MPAMTTYSNELSGRRVAESSMVLASDSERHGRTMHRALEQGGFAIEYAGSYAELESVLREREFDMVLLEVTSEHAVEPAVATALRVKRAHPGQFVGYLADAHLETSGLAGDAIYPRSAVRLRDALRDRP
jgi:DNA-binding NtrC family response regulator